MPITDPHELAKAFSEELRRHLTQEQMELVNERNAAETNKSICHSHDFCDANQVMLDALGGEYDGDDEQGWLFNQAWAIARDAEFSPVMIDNNARDMREHE